VPRRPRGVDFGTAGGIGPASSPGCAGVTGAAVGSAGVTGAATGSAAAAGSAAGAGAGMRRARAARFVPAGVNEQTCVAPSTLVSVSRSRDFFACSETMVGTTAGVVPVAGVNYQNCIATPV
jgi:hypothetical protein